MLAILLVLSLVVSLDVFWSLRKPGLTLAGDADCGMIEHTHDKACINGDTPCELTEHVHTIECYSDETADIESQLDWQKMFEDYPFTGNLGTDLVGIAKTQVGYSESKLNFEVNQNGIRHGYTRYGAWYGTPYSDWSATFVSFCLHYSGAPPDKFPINIGATSMAEQWKRLGRYVNVSQYKPISGDLVFFKDNSVGIISEIFNTTIHIIRGDVNDSVVDSVVSLNDSSIVGWGLVGRRLFENNTTNVSSGPKVFIFEGGVATAQMQRFSLRSSRAIIDLLPYLEANGGSYFFTLLDKNNQELLKDADGNYIAQANTEYKLTISFNSPEGFSPGTYQYQVPNGLMVDGGEGTFILTDGTNVGSWVVTDTGLITLVFNEHMNSRTDITISA
ncbi:MAG: hypothetical protein IJE65_04425, partial [Clostridia bacterium]|nr:hypothetical protein [Clostridia bacterium]